MRKLFASSSIMLTAAALLAALGVAVSIYAHNFLWFARSGALITGIGVIVLTRPSVVGKDIMLRIVMDQSGLTQLDPEYYVRRNEQIPAWLIEDRKSRNAVGIFGPILTVFGTLIWGFADLLNIPLGFN
ncbi:MAG: hypothetical protein DME22_12465 [Verrucomicrobia bacterium]|nr:MAG: hypothetical protein DME22_12465 [Verrucomicrobiota bacterium]PYJ97408.1 MAG: hypothetical protein DME23_15605 [Verrucomicrobiota bacterium]